MKNILDLINNSRNILVISHMRPDPDAAASQLFVFGVLKENFKEKNIYCINESNLPNNLSFLSKYRECECKKLLDAVEEYNIDMIIATDANTTKRITREDIEEVRKIVSEKSIKFLFIDHHEEEETFLDDYIAINNKLSSATEQAYKLLIDDLNLKTYDGYAETVMTGILSDTSRFKYKNEKHRDTFRIVSKLIEDGAVIERIESRLNRISPDCLPIISEFISNIVISNDHVYTYIADETSSKYDVSVESTNIFSEAGHFVADSFLKYIDGIEWGYVIYADKGIEKRYKGAFRATDDCIDTTVFSTLFDGGGHKSSSGFAFQADSIQQAIERIETAINQNREKALRNVGKL